jgi:hypothetical protein
LIPPSPLLSAGLLPQLRRFWPLAAGLGGGLILLESSRGPLSSLVSLSAAAAGFWVLRGRLRPSGRALPKSVEGWLERCQNVLECFERLAPDADPLEQQQRREQLEQLRRSQGDSHLQVALVGLAGWTEALQAQLLQHCRSPLPLRVLRGQPLPLSSAAWHWPDAFRRCDLIVYRLTLPLSAADLRWLEALPKGQEALLLVDRPSGDWSLALHQLQHQLPEHLRPQCWPWSPERSEDCAVDLQPLARAFAALGPERLRLTQQRCLEELHGSWQLALESLRRRQWQQLMQRTQWTVAAGVVVAPLPSLDLLVLAAANGLMLQEMARLWDCPWSLEQLQAAALHLAKACLALGVVEWSAQALGVLVKLHGATWLVGGALQALSAAYLTRVVGRAMADYMALAAGVPEADLERLLQQQAPLLVARAAEEEKLDWTGFLQQAQQWLQQSGTALALKPS